MTIKPVTTLRTISAIARDIRKAWPKVYFGAVPYLQAMASLETIHSRYGMEDGKSIVLYFLSNASTFRGDIAKTLKAELKQHLKG